MGQVQRLLVRYLPLRAILPCFIFCRQVLGEFSSHCVHSGLRCFFCARAISPFLLAKDTSIVNAVNERFGLADRA